MHLDDAWAAYCDAEIVGFRRVSLTRLEQVIECAHRLPEDEREAWSFRVARHAVDESLAPPIRMPLFREVLFPDLRDGMRRGHSGCARWLAGFAHLIQQSPDLGDQLPEHNRTEIGLLRTALQLDSNDALARTRLIRSMLRYFDYTLHELPAGVLYGIDGANIEECRELRRLLREFELLVDAQGLHHDYSAIIKECRFHYIAYSDYLKHLEDYASYAEYLEKRRERG